jgi:hypothetical protein
MQMEWVKTGDRVEGRPKRHYKQDFEDGTHGKWPTPWRRQEIS